MLFRSTRELSYSEDQAYRRIQAMRLLKELPEIEEKINDGSLSLTHLGMAQSLFKREEKSQKNFSKKEKIEILEKLKNTSKREAEKITVSFSSSPVVPFEKIRAVSRQDVEIKFTAKEEVLKKIQKLKALLAHRNPNLRLSELFDQLCDLGIEKWDKSKPSAPKQTATIAQSSAPARAARQQKQVVQSNISHSLEPVTKAQMSDLRSLAPMTKAQIKREVWQRDQGRCQICNSQYAIEIDHKFPRALGGSDTKENLRLLCRSCNQRAAIEAFGLQKMEKHINGPTT